VDELTEHMNGRRRNGIQANIMKQKFLSFIMLITTFGCHSEKECNPNCGPLQRCDDGVCACNENQFIMGNSCITRCADCFEGSFDCGCTDTYVFDITQFDSATRQVTLYYVTPGTIGMNRGSTDVTKLSSNMYKFNIPRRCDVGSRRSTNKEFTVDTADPTKLAITARYHILMSNETLATCSTVFTK